MSIKRFNRFELKYLVPVGLRDAMLPEITERMPTDPSGREGLYAVTSLYYDTDDLAFYRSKVEGIKYRRKLRIRIYGDRESGPNPPVMFEIKQRINRTTQKRRVPLPLEQAYALAGGGALPPVEEPQDLEVAGEIALLARSLHLRSTCLVGYLRRAFVGGEHERGLRITFDHALWCSQGLGGVLDRGPRRSMLRPDTLVMEVKANDAVPIWVSRMLVRHGVGLIRYSKYCSGVACLARHGVLTPSTYGDARWMS